MQMVMNNLFKNIYDQDDCELTDTNKQSVFE